MLGNKQNDEQQPEQDAQVDQQPEQEMDEETQRLLDELENDKPKTAKAQSKKKTAKKKAVKKDAKLTGDTVVNNTRNPRRINAVTIGPGESYTLTKADKENERLMAKIHYSFKLGLLVNESD